MRVASKPSGLPGRTLVSRVSAILNQGEERKERIGGRRKERTLWVLRALSTTFYLGKPAAGPAAQSAPEISGRVLIFPVSGMGTLQAVEDPDPSYVIFVFQAPPPAHQPQVRPGNELKRDTPFFFFFLTFMAQE